MEIVDDKISSGAHICSIYKYFKEQILVTIPLFLQGLNVNEKCIYVADKKSQEQLVDVFAQRKPGIKKIIESGQLALLDNNATYLKDGTLDVDRTINAIKDAERKALEDGFRGVRLSGELPLVSEKPIEGDIVVNYESIADKYFSASKTVAMCHYEEDKYSPDVLAKVIKAHHFVTIYGNCYENKFYLQNEGVPESYESLVSAIIEG